jgi:hypothetical protein
MFAVTFSNCFGFSPHPARASKAPAPKTAKGFENQFDKVVI